MGIRKGLVLVVVVLGLVGCGKEDVVEEDVEEVASGEFYDDEEGGMEEYRVKGDRLMEVPVLEEEERDKRIIKQYELIDRPIILNTMKHIEEFDKEQAGFFEGVTLISNKAIEKLKERKRILYREELGNPIHEDVVMIYDIKEEYPYSEDDFKSYYSTVVNGLSEEVFLRTRLYDTVESLVEKEDFEGLKSTRAILGMRRVVRSEGSLVEQYRPYIQEMDKIIKGKREKYGIEDIKYVNIKEDVEEVAKYIVPEQVTLQEIKQIEVDEDDFYGRIEEIEEEGKESGEAE